MRLRVRVDQFQDGHRFSDSRQGVSHKLYVDSIAALLRDDAVSGTSEAPEHVLASYAPSESAEKYSERLCRTRSIKRCQARAVPSDIDQNLGQTRRCSLVRHYRLPTRLNVVGNVARQHRQFASVGVHNIDLFITAAVAHESDAAAIWRPVRILIKSRILEGRRGQVL